MREGDLPWETWEGDPGRGSVYWKTLFGGGSGQTDSITFGISLIPPGGTFRRHRHPQPEIYFILEDGVAVFVPGGTFHSSRNTGDSDLRFVYVFPVDSFEDVEYHFEERP